MIISQLGGNTIRTKPALACCAAANVTLKNSRHYGCNVMELFAFVAGTSFPCFPFFFSLPTSFCLLSSKVCLIGKRRGSSHLFLLILPELETRHIRGGRSL